MRTLRAILADVRAYPTVCARVRRNLMRPDVRPSADDNGKANG